MKTPNACCTRWVMARSAASALGAAASGAGFLTRQEALRYCDDGWEPYRVEMTASRDVDDETRAEK